MASTLLYRACALVVVGIVAGAVHSGVVPVKLHPDAPAPIIWPKPGPKPADNGPPAQPNAITPEQPKAPPPPQPPADEMAGMNLTLA